MSDKEMIRGYKGFEKGLVCRGKKYAENTTFIERNAELCKSGMHFCENPLNVMQHYPCYDGKDFSEYAAVESTKERAKSDEKKSVTDELYVKGKISFTDLITRGVAYTLEHANKTSANTGDCSASTNTGNRSASLVTGDYSKASVTQNSVAIALGEESYAKADIGGFIVIAECKYDEDNKKTVILDCKCFKVDGRTIEANTYYTLRDGEAIKLEERKS